VFVKTVNAEGSVAVEAAAFPFVRALLTNHSDDYNIELWTVTTHTCAAPTAKAETLAALLYDAGLTDPQVHKLIIFLVNACISFGVSLDSRYVRPSTCSPD
jgi:hypothetical protein